MKFQKLIDDYLIDICVNKVQITLDSLINTVKECEDVEGIEFDNAKYYKSNKIAYSLDVSLSTRTFNWYYIWLYMKDDNTLCIASIRDAKSGLNIIKNTECDFSPKELKECKTISMKLK